MNKFKTLMLMVALVGMAGCTSVTTPNGWKYRSTIFQKQIDSIDMAGSTNGAYTLKVKGYRSEAATMAEAIATGVAKGMNPAP